MKAVCWYGTEDVRVQEVSDPAILNPRDAIIRITLTTICGSDLHIYDGVIPGMEKGDIIGHEMVGEVVEVGPEVKDFKVGDRVVVISVIACGQCWHCRNQEYSLCDNTNPNAWMVEKAYNYSPAAIFGHSHLFGGYAGSQAEYVRVPFADVNAFHVPGGMTDEQALMCSDMFPTGYMAADLCEPTPADTVAVWGCGPVGLFAIKSAYLLGADHVIAIDNVPERLLMAAEKCGATALNYDEVDVAEALAELTGGRGPDCCIDAVGMESHGASALVDAYDRVKQTLRLAADRADVLRQMIVSCRKGGRISVIGGYSLLTDKIPFGAAFSKGLQFRMGLQQGQKYLPRLFEHFETGEIDPSFVVTHRLLLDDAPRAYEMFKHKYDHCVKLALQP